MKLIDRYKRDNQVNILVLYKPDEDLEQTIHYLLSDHVFTIIANKTVYKDMEYIETTVSHSIRSIEIYFGNSDLYHLEQRARMQLDIDDVAIYRNEDNSIFKINANDSVNSINFYLYVQR